MSSKIKTVGVVGTGVIGSSWTALFLSQGLKVLVSDPAPRAEKALASYLDTVWPTLKEIGLASGASATNYKFVGSDLTGYYDQVDFVQEVRRKGAALGVSPLTIPRTRRSGRTSRSR